MAPASGPTVAAEQARPGRLLRTWRKRFGLTQEELAAATPYSVSHVKRVERGEANPSPTARAKLAKALSMDPAELFADFPPSRAEREKAEAAARQEKVNQFYRATNDAGRTMPQLANELDVSITTVWRAVHEAGLPTRMGPPPQYADKGRLCKDCGEPLKYSHPSDHANLRGERCRACYEEGRAYVRCPGCGEGRWRSRSQVRKVQCIRCRVKNWKKGTSRQKWLGRYEGRKYGKLGGRPMVQLTDEQRTEAAKLMALNWGRRAIAKRLGVSEWAVRNTSLGQ